MHTLSWLYTLIYSQDYHCAVRNDWFLLLFFSFGSVLLCSMDAQYLVIMDSNFLQVDYFPTVVRWLLCAGTQQPLDPRLSLCQKYFCNTISLCRICVGFVRTIVEIRVCHRICLFDTSRVFNNMFGVLVNCYLISVFTLPVSQTV